jgi:hypothetical protein
MFKVKYDKIVWLLAAFCGITCALSSSVLAAKAHPEVLNQVVQCETSLKKFCTRLQDLRTRNNQVYYENLYQQVQDYLKKIRALSADPSHLERCENLLKSVHDIIGSHPSDLGSMPVYISPANGKLTKPGLETAASRRNMRKSIQFECSDRAFRRQKDATHEMEEGDEGNEFLLTSGSSRLPLSSRTKGALASEESKKRD